MRGGDRAVGERARGEEQGKDHATGTAGAGGQGDRSELCGAEPQAERRGRVWSLERDRVEQRLRRRDAVDGRLERLLAPEQGLRIPQREEARAEPRPGADPRAFSFSVIVVFWPSFLGSSYGRPPWLLRGRKASAAGGKSLVAHQSRRGRSHLSSFVLVLICFDFDSILFRFGLDSVLIRF